MRVRKTVSLITCVFTGLLLITGCTGSPERMVKKYLDYTFLDNNGKDAYDLLSADDKAYVSKDEFCKSVRNSNVLSKKVMEKYEDYFYYEITDKREEGDTVYVTAELNRPNAFYILSDLVSYAMVTAFGSLPEHDRTQAIGKKFDAIMMSKNRLVTSEEKVFKLVKESGRYRIYINAGAEEKQRKLRSRALQMMSEAEELEKSIEFDKALELYTSAADLCRQKLFLEKKQRLEHVRDNLLQLGEVKVFGNILFRPEKVAREPLALLVNDSEEIKKNGFKPGDNVLVLTYSLRNVSEGQVFRPVDLKSGFKSAVSDDFGNQMQVCNILEKEQGEHLRPGEQRSCNTICELPLTETARNFVWKIKINTSNAGDMEDIYIKFSKEEWSNLVALSD